MNERVSCHRGCVPGAGRPVVGGEIDLTARVEAALMMVLYNGEGAAAQLPDKGMHLAPRWPGEPPLVVSIRSPVKLHGVPASLQA